MSEHPTTEVRPPTVLIVDDTPSILQFFIRGLEYYGFQACLASSGREAIELLRSNPDRITVALIDRQMPEMDGLATMKALMQIKPSLRCCIMSGSTNEDEAELWAAGVHGVLAKPFHLAVLRDCLLQLHDESLAACAFGQ